MILILKYILPVLHDRLKHAFLTEPARLIYASQLNQQSCAASQQELSAALDERASQVFVFVPVLYFYY